MVFKLSVISDEVSQDLNDLIVFAREFSLDGLEIRTLFNRKPHELVDLAGSIRTSLRNAGLEVSAVASPVFKSNIDDEAEYKQHLKIFEHCVELAKTLDTSIIRVFTFWKKNGIEQVVDRIVELYQPLIDAARSEGVILGVENEPSTYASNGLRLSKFLWKVGTKTVKAIWDPGNDIWDPEGEKPYPDGYNYVRNNVVHVHVKDGVRKGPGGSHEFTPVGEGEVNYREQLKALAFDKYRGYLSLETHWRPRVKLEESKVLMPGGAEYSRLGFEASRICMRNLVNMLRELGL
ncbi:MAG: sugar phosphate isomerase/epimerase family protein [Candidatus Bathyarchaeia archaeon]